MSNKKTKKQRKKKTEKKRKKRQNLLKIDKQFIIDNQCWIPRFIKPINGKSKRTKRLLRKKKVENLKKKTAKKDMPKIVIKPKPLKKTISRKSNSWFNIESDRKKPVIRRRRFLVDSTTQLRAKRVELFPTSSQKAKLLDWMESYRRLYNLTITNRFKFMKDDGYMISPEKMRDIMLKKILPKHKNLHSEIYKTYMPENIRSKHTVLAQTIRNAVVDVNKAFVSAKANQKAGNIRRFRLRHKKETNPVRTLVIEAQSFRPNKNAFAIKALGIMKSSQKFGVVTHDCRLSYNYNTDKFILWMPYDKVTPLKEYKSRIIALDPGMRTFQNGYSPDGICYKFATDETNDKIKRLLERIDNVKKKGKRYKRFTKRLRKKVTDMVADLHWKTANFLCKNFHTILVGNMSTTGIVKKEKSVLTKFDKKYCIALSHYKFRERLISKAAEYYVDCLIVDESYTTKTCGKCGEVNENVGAKSVFRCPVETCKFRMDRDYNAGRNIYLKAMSRGLF